MVATLNTRDKPVGSIDFLRLVLIGDLIDL